MNKFKYKVLSLHPRKQHNFEQAAVLHNIYNGNFKHITTFYFGSKALRIVGMMSTKAASFLAKRSYAALPVKAVKCFPGTAIKMWLKHRLGKYYSFYMQNVDFQKEIIKKVSPPEICISFDGQSDLIFENWKGKSKLILDLTIALPQYFLKTMHGSNYNNSMLTETDEFHNRIYGIAFKEIELADIILCGSEYVKQSVMFFRPQFENKCRILTYGAAIKEFGFEERKFVAKENLKYVAVGTVDTRKGADTLMKVWSGFIKQQPQCELHFFGSVHMDIDQATLPPNVFLHGRVDKKTLIEQLKQMDVFVLPSLHEGSSIAIFQAMAMQLPVITTINSGTVLVHNQSCEIVKANDENELGNALKKLFSDLNYRTSIASNAYALSKTFTWDHYQQRLAAILNEQ